MAGRTRKTSDTDETPETTSGQTFAEAAEGFTEAHEQGYIGTSAEAERTGRADKGLSQQSPGIMDGSTPAPDARKHVDDSEALKGLASKDATEDDDAEAKS